jgi:hypothetical protein
MLKNTFFVEAHVFRSLFRASIFSLACCATAASAAEIFVNKPPAKCPKTRFGDEDIQARYDKAWMDFSTEIDGASAALAKELKSQRDAAQGEGNLDLLKFWMKHCDRFQQTGQFRWDPDAERRTWARFGGPTFPHSMTTQAKKAVDTYARGLATLADQYKQIEVALVRLGDVEQAEKIRQEKADATEANPFE